MTRKNIERKTRRWENVGKQNRGGQSSQGGLLGVIYCYVLTEQLLSERVCPERAHTAERVTRRTNPERYLEIQGSLRMCPVMV